MAPSRSSAAPASASRRLESWKEIGAYLNRSVTTVQRWEQEEGLPVHRLLHAKSGSVYALTDELDAWYRNRDSLSQTEQPSPAAGEASAAVLDAPPPGAAGSAGFIKAGEDWWVRFLRVRWSVTAAALRRWHVAVPAIVTAASLVAWLFWSPAAPPRIASVRPLVSDLERLGEHPPPADRWCAAVTGWSWATDGERVYLAMPRRAGQAPSGSSALYQMPVAGGEPTELALPFQYAITILDHVPGESALLVAGTTEPPVVARPQSELPLWLVPVPSGAPRRIPNLRAHWADVSRDGTTLAMIESGDQGLRRLTLAQIDGSGRRDLGPLPAHVFGARWAPDGRRLRLFVGGLGRSAVGDSIWEISVQGGPPRRLGPGSGGDWTRDGRYFVYDRVVYDPDDRVALRQDLFAEREGGRPALRTQAPERLTVGPLSFWSPGPSPDGRQVFAYGRAARGELMRLDSATRTFTPALGGESAFYVEPSPDGEWLVWVHYPDGTLWKSRTDGSLRQQLTRTPLEAHLPQWSPDGRTIAFAGRTPDEPRLAIHVVAADGSAGSVVARPERVNDYYWDPCWRPDGTLVFSRLLSTEPGGILHLDPKTKRVDQMPDTDSLRWPKCSMQGDLLATADGPSGPRYVVLRGGTERWEDLGPMKLAYPQWTRDGRSICGIDIQAGRIDCVSVASQQAVTLAEAPPFPLLSWFGVAWMGLDADDRPLVVADRGTTGFYALEWERP
jgi:Tol biopolymer transport system component